MAYKTVRRDGTVIVSKTLPMKLGGKRFGYGFVSEGMTEEQIENGISWAKKSISKDIRLALRKDNGTVKS